MSPNGIEIFNPVTKRWVLERGIKGGAILNENAGTRFGNRDTQVRAIYNKSRVRHIRNWNIVKYTREESTTVIKMVNFVLSEINPNMTNVLLDLTYYDSDGNVVFLTTKITPNMSRRRLYNLLIDRHVVYGIRSDAVHDTLELYTRAFKLRYKLLAGGNSRDKFTTHKTKYYKVQSYKCDEGDCLLAIIKQPHVKIEQMRKELLLPKGLININSIEHIENFYGININVLEDSIKIERKTEDTNESNATVTRAKKVFLYKSPSINKYETYNVLLDNGHYSEIVKPLPLYADETCGDILEVKNGKPIKLTKEQKMKSLKRQERDIAGENNREKFIEKFLFFDIETVFDPTDDNVLKVYSVSWWVWDKDIKPPKFTEKNIDKYVNKTFIETGENSMEKFVDWIGNNDEGIRYTLIGYNNSRFDNFPLLHETLKRDEFSSLLYVQNSLLALRFLGKHQTFDLCRFIMCSLKDATKNFNAYPRKMDGFSHFDSQDTFMNDRWKGLNKWIDTNIDLLTKYNKYDVLATASLFFIVRHAYAKLLETGDRDAKNDILKFPTLASMSYAGCVFNWKQRAVDIPAVKRVHDIIIRNTIVGGRCQLFKVTYKIDEKLYCVDVKSLYPYIMLNRYFPIGECEEVDKYTNEYLGVYRVKVLEQPKIKIKPLRNEDELDWDYEGEIDTYMTSIEIECLKRHGGKLKFRKLHDSDNIGIIWKNSSNEVFNSFLEPIKAEKTRQDILAKQKSPEYNPAMRNITKLLLNSLSGKMLQRNFETITVMVKNQNEEDKFDKKTEPESREIVQDYGHYLLMAGKLKDHEIYKEKKAKPAYLGIFIYAYARTYMYDLLYSNYDVLYTDTDSAVLKEQDFNDFKSKLIKKCGTQNNEYYILTNNEGVPTIGGEFGQFEEELSTPQQVSSEAYLLAKKMYAIEMKDKDGKVIGTSKYRLKGVNLGKPDLPGIPGEPARDCLITKEFAEQIEKMEIDLDKIKDEDDRKEQYEKNQKYLYEKYKEFYEKKDTNRIKVFRELHQNRECYFICSVLRKQKMLMHQSFIIKHIKI